MSFRTNLDAASIDELLANHRKGYSLDRGFYLDEAVFELEYDHLISRQWQYVDHLNRIPNKGDYLLFRIAGEEVIVVRGDGDTVYAHFNVCRHRGSRICLEAEGNAKRLVCPYHAWSYRLDGSLANARAMPADFDRESFGLKSCQVRVFAGLIFINLTVDPSLVPSFAPIEAALQPWLARAELQRTKIVFHEIYPSQVNWKIAIENYFECYHCLTTHPELCRVQLATQRDGLGTEPAIAEFKAHNDRWEKEARALGHMTGTMWRQPAETDADNYFAQMYYAERMISHPDLDGGYEKLGMGHLKRPSKLLGSYETDDNGLLDWGIMPSCFVYTSCTSTVIYRITPLSATESELAQTWLVHEDAVEDIDYDVEGVTWVDRQTQFQDEEIVRNTQAGVTSRYYEPGPYALLEGPILQVHDDYLRLLRYGRTLK